MYAYANLSYDQRGEFLARRDELDQIVHDELIVRAQGAFPGGRRSWCCQECNASTEYISNLPLPGPAELEHTEECAWLQRWLMIPDYLRWTYVHAWGQRHPTAKQWIRPRAPRW